MNCKTCGKDAGTTFGLGPEPEYCYPCGRQQAADDAILAAVMRRLLVKTEMSVARDALWLDMNETLWLDVSDDEAAAIRRCLGEP